MWRFVHLTDTHLGGDRDSNEGMHHVIRTLMPDAIACLRRDLNRLAPDFVLVTGDITAAQDRDAYFAARDLLDSLSIPYYPLGGNCDHAREDGRRCFLEAFGSRLPEGRTHFTFAHRNMRFIALDPWWLCEDGSLTPHRFSPESPLAWAVPPAQLKWVEEVLESDPDTPTVVACHYPIASPLTTQPQPEHERGRLEMADLLLRILRRHRQVRLYLCGHAHLHHVEPVGHFAQVITAAFCEYPVEYRVFEVGETYLGMTTVGLSNARFAAHSLVAEYRWTAGDPEHRSLRVPMAEGAAPR